MTHNSFDLNQLVSVPTFNEGVSSADGIVTAYFSDLDKHLIEHIQRAEIVVGCVAWLTHFRIIQALASVPYGTSILVQKEDFLRPDIDSDANWRNELRIRYSELKSLAFWPDTLNIVSAAANGDQFIEPVRCVGIYNHNKVPALPRMHHKFLVFCQLHETIITQTGEASGLKAVLPYAVWTGSFNLTQNALKSLENAVVITDSIIAEAYYQQWQQVAWISEPLDWNQNWVQPEWSTT